MAAWKKVSETQTAQVAGRLYNGHDYCQKCSPLVPSYPASEQQSKCAHGPLDIEPPKVVAEWGINAPYLYTHFKNHRISGRTLHTLWETIAYFLKPCAPRGLG